MTPELVSVVIPVYNGAAHLRQAIESVLSQTYAAVELIAVDDGSTDESPAVLQQYANRLTIIRQANAGVATARNSGIQRATGEFIAFLDQDDWWHPEKLERQVAVFREDDGIGLVHTDVAYFADEQKTFVLPPNPDTNPSSMVGNCFDRLLLGNHITNSSVVVRRSMLDRYGLCNTSLKKNTVADHDLWLRIAKNSRVGFVDQRLTYFRIHAGQGSASRIAMLSDEIGVILQYRSKQEWKATPQGRQRLGDLYDELATAYFDSHQPHPARRYFATALSYNPTPRQISRYLASCLPYWLAVRCRDAIMHLRQRRLSRVSQA